MKKLSYLIFMFALFGGFMMFVSCEDEIKYSTDPSHRLAFSRDTVSFDTVFTTIGSSTQTLIIYNRNDEALNITSLTLADSRRSGFRVNVDGQSGVNFSNVEIRKKDSLYILVEIIANEQNHNLPVFVKDSLAFELSNGVKQWVNLCAYGQDAIKWTGKTIMTDTVLTSYKPILIYDSLKIAEGCLLTLQQGTRLYLHDKAEVLVYGKMKAEGTLESPVVFRGDRTDNMINIPYDRIPGQWGGIKFAKSSYENELNYVDIHGGKYGILCDTSNLDRLKLSLNNSVIHNVKGDGLSLIFCIASVMNSQITNAGKNCVYILGGISDFLHCTIANHYNWEIRRGKALYFTNVSDSVGFPIYQASFRNCLITGSGEDDLQGIHSEDTVQNPFKYLFTNCVINSKDEGKPNFINVKWEEKQEKNSNFLYIGKTDYEYDFRLDSASVAINYGRVEDALQCPLDRMGRFRLEDGQPDVGCYEWRSGDGNKE